MKKFSRIISVFVVLVMMFSLLTFESAAASITKIEIVQMPTKTTFVKGVDWDYGYWKFPEDEGTGVFTPRNDVISFMHNGGKFSYYSDRGMLDMSGLVVKVTYSNGTTKNIAYKETVNGNGVQQNIYVSPSGSDYKVGENTVEIYFLSDINAYTTFKIYLVEKMMGDINSDSKVNSADALMALQSAVKIITLSSEQKAVADMNSDNKINSLDALAILQKSVGM